MRLPAVAGTFYPADKEELEKAIRLSFLSKFGPGKLLKKKSSGKIFGAVVPHAGYEYSGSAAAHVYKELAEAEKPEIIIILGPPHTYPTTVSMWQGADWATPLGKVSITRDVKLDWDKDPLPHMEEHCIEVQLPFLQTIYDKIPKILPIVVSAPLEHCIKLGKQLASALKGKKALILASSDFTHAGPAYGFTPPRPVKEIDMECINNILTLNVKGLDEQSTICGISGIAVMLSTLKELHPTCKGKLLKYYTSSEISGDKLNSVSYAAIIFR